MAYHTLGTERRDGGAVRVGYSKGMPVVKTSYKKWIIRNSSLPNTRLSILENTPNLPVPGLTIDEDGLGICEDIEIVRSEIRQDYWELTVNNSSQIDEGSGNSGEPEEWIPVRTTITVPQSFVSFHDYNGRPYLTGARQPFSSAPNKRYQLVRWDFWQFEPITVTDQNIADRIDSINSAPFLDCDVYTLLLEVRKSTVGWYQKRKLRMTEYSLTWKPDRWTTKTANQGEMFLYEGKMYPYIYSSAPNTIVCGPLGQRDITYDITDFTDEDGLPTGVAADDCVEISGNRVFAKPTNTPKLYYIETVDNRPLDFRDFLRVV